MAVDACGQRDHVLRSGLLLAACHLQNLSVVMMRNDRRILYNVDQFKTITIRLEWVVSRFVSFYTLIFWVRRSR